MKKALITPLYWGLGHATRCIPLIQGLLEHGFEVIIASDGQALTLLKLEFPALRALELPGYNIVYKSENMLWNMFLLTPDVLKAIRKEKKIVDKIVAEYQVDIVISDNRYGCYSKYCKNIFITHQIQIQTGNRLGNWIAEKVNRFLLSKFQKLWIPDVENIVNLSGILSHGIGQFNLPISYIGILSRLKEPDSLSGKSVLVILSGPEPQRRIFEQKIREQIINLNYPVIIVRGVMKGKLEARQEGNTTIYDYADSARLNTLLNDALVVVSRCGYTTVMDLVITKRKALLVPTPGQTEQIYLAQHLNESGIFAFQTQKDFDLKSGIAKALSKNSINIGGAHSLKTAISELYEELNSK
ncbi:MAG: glycosyltransferase [Saprospiraceae bacterium]